jgi:TRAP-type C4-dicarboxylate transport system substrate-binding protein
MAGTGLSDHFGRISIMTRTAFRSAAVAAAAAVALAASAQAQTKIGAMTALPSTLDLAKSFQEIFIGEANARKAAGYQVNFLGGPEIQPPAKAAAALRRGVIDMLHSPTSYYIGEVPEGYALTLATTMPDDIRANGGFKMLQKYWEKINAHLLAWGEAGTAYNTYLTKEPGFTKDGLLSLDGFKMRTTGTYRPLFMALGASAIAMKASEIYTGLQRGVVQGFGWPDVGIKALGLDKLVKYRIQQPFYRSNNTVAINLDVWKGMTQKARDALSEAALAYEKKAIGYMEERRKKDEAALFAAGAKDVVLRGKAKQHYIDAANVAVWDQLKKHSPDAAALQKTIFPGWTPPKG